MRHLAALTLALCAIAGCHGGDPPPDADEALACIASGRGDTFAVGLDHAGAGGTFDFKLMSATPAPPGFNDNTWVIQVNQVAGGAAVTGATLTVAPFMPDHQHGPGAIKPTVEPMPAAGQYKASTIHLWMPGYWEVTIDAQAAAGHDSAVFKFCIQA